MRKNNAAIAEALAKSAKEAQQLEDVVSDDVHNPFKIVNGLEVVPYVKEEAGRVSWAMRPPEAVMNNV